MNELNAKLWLSAYILANICLLVSLIVRYIIIIKDKSFANQSKLKNLFYGLYERPAFHLRRWN